MGDRMVRVKATVNVIMFIEQDEPVENAGLSVKALIAEGFEGGIGEEYDRLEVTDINSEEITNG